MQVAQQGLGIAGTGGTRTCLEDLPDSVLGSIFTLVESDELASLALVSRRVHRVLFSEAALWREVELTHDSLVAAAAAGQEAQWFRTNEAVLRRVGRYVESMEVTDFESIARREEPGQHGAFEARAVACGSDWRVGSAVLPHLSPAVLSSFALHCEAVDAPLLEALAHFTGLTSLALACNGVPLLAGPTASLMQALPQLRCLALEMRGALPERMVGSLQHLSQLEHLTMFASTLPALDQLAALSRLTALDWTETGRFAGSVKLDVQRLCAQLPCLEKYAVTVESTHEGRGDGCLEVDGALLHQLRVDIADPTPEGSGETAPGMAAASAATPAGPPPGAAPASGVASGQTTASAAMPGVELTLCGIRHIASLRQLVTKALPPGTPATSVRSLSIFHSHLSSAALQDCPQLAYATQLLLSVCTIADDVEGAVQALLQQAPRLQCLTLLACLEETRCLPAVVAGRTGLRWLCLRRNQLTSLPEGLWLRDLEHLDLAMCSLKSLPPVLAGASKLQTLCLLENDDLALTHADVDSILLRLRQLVMGTTKTPAPVLAHLARSAPALDISDSSDDFLFP